MRRAQTLKRGQLSKGQYSGSISACSAIATSRFRGNLPQPAEFCLYEAQRRRPPSRDRSGWTVTQVAGAVRRSDPAFAFFGDQGAARPSPDHGRPQGAETTAADKRRRSASASAAMAMAACRAKPVTGNASSGAVSGEEFGSPARRPGGSAIRGPATRPLQWRSSKNAKSSSAVRLAVKWAVAFRNSWASTMSSSSDFRRSPASAPNLSAASIAMSLLFLAMSLRFETTTAS